MEISFLELRLSRRTLAVLFVLIINSISNAQITISKDSLDVIELKDIFCNGLDLTASYDETINNYKKINFSIEIENYDGDDGENMKKLFLKKNGVHLFFEDNLIVSFGIDFDGVGINIKNNQVKRNQKIQHLFPFLPMLKIAYEKRQSFHLKEEQQGKNRSVVNSKTDDRYFIKLRVFYNDISYTNRISIDVKDDKIQSVSGDLTFNDWSELEKK